MFLQEGYTPQAFSISSILTPQNGLIQRSCHFISVTLCQNPSVIMADYKKGRRKQDFERLHKKEDRNIAFSKAGTFASAFGCELAIIILTECKQWHAYSCLPSQEGMTNFLSYFLQNPNPSNHTTAAEIRAVRN